MGWLKAAFKGIKGVGKFVKHGVKGLISKKANSNNPLQGFQNTGIGGNSITGTFSSGSGRVNMPTKWSKMSAKILEFITSPVGVGSVVAALGGFYWFKQPKGRRRRRR
jgi:hypothetical protein